MKNGEVLEGLETNRIKIGEYTDEQLDKLNFTVDHIDIVYSQYKP